MCSHYISLQKADTTVSFKTTRDLSKLFDLKSPHISRYINSDTAVPGEVGPQEDLVMEGAGLPIEINADMARDRRITLDKMPRDMKIKIENIARQEGISMTRGMKDMVRENRVSMKRGFDFDSSLRRSISIGVVPPAQQQPPTPQPKLSVLPLRLEKE